MDVAKALRRRPSAGRDAGLSGCGSPMGSTGVRKSDQRAVGVSTFSTHVGGKGFTGNSIATV